MKRILITGGNGFIGRNLYEYFRNLLGEENVFAPGRMEMNLLNENEVEEYIKNRRVQIVIHCGVSGGTRKTSYDVGATDVVYNNLRMFFNLERVLFDDMRMIIMGSGAEYDLRNYIPKMREDYFDLHVPVDAYGYSKYLISKYVEKKEGLVVLRLFGVYGKYEDYTYKFISNAIVKNLLKMPITIKQNVVFDYLFIDDLCRIVERFITVEPRFKHYNVTPSQSVDLIGIARVISEIGNYKSEIKILNPGLNTEYTGENERLLKELGDFNFTTYREGIENLYKYYRENLNLLDLEMVKKDPYIDLCRVKKDV